MNSNPPPNKSPHVELLKRSSSQTGKPLKRDRNRTSIAEMHGHGVAAEGDALGFRLWARLSEVPALSARAFPESPEPKATSLEPEAGP